MFSYHRVREWFSLKGTSGVQHLLLKQEQLQLLTQTHVQMAFEDRQGCRLYHLAAQAVPVLCHLQSEELLPGVQRESPMFLFVPVASCPFTGHQ